MLILFKTYVTNSAAIKMASCIKDILEECVKTDPIMVSKLYPTYGLALSKEPPEPKLSSLLIDSSSIHAITDDGDGYITIHTNSKSKYVLKDTFDSVSKMITNKS